MKNPGRLQAEPGLFESAKFFPDSNASLKFAGTENPRYLRAIQALLVRALTREQLDRVAGCSNGPDLIRAIRNLGMGTAGLACTMIPDFDRDGFPIRRGVYHFTKAGRHAVLAWRRSREGSAQKGATI